MKTGKKILALALVALMLTVAMNFTSTQGTTTHIPISCQTLLTIAHSALLSRVPASNSHSLLTKPSGL